MQGCKRALLKAIEAALPHINSLDLRQDLRRATWILPIDDTQAPVPELADEKIIHKEVEDKIDYQWIERYVYEHKVRRVVTFRGDAPFVIDEYYKHENATAIITRSGDGCYAIDIPKRYLYGAEMRAVHRALTKFMEEEVEIKKRNRKRGWDYAERLSKKFKIEGKLTLTRREALKVLRTIKHRETVDQTRFGPTCRVEVLYEGTWLHMARTDLMNDVCTTIGMCNFKHYRKQMVYGVRVSDKTFAVIDSLSDG